MKKRKIIGYSVMSLIVMVLVVASVFAVSLSGTSETETQKNYSNPQKTAIGGAVSETEMKFTDVSETAWYYNDVKNAYELGLINGRSEVLFVPEGNLTYAEAAKLAACMYQVYTGDQVIIAGGNPWYQVYVDYCLEKGIVLENHDWQADITRGAYMDIFSRALPQDALVEINRIDPDMIPDVNSGYVYAEGIYACTVQELRRV